MPAIPSPQSVCPLTRVDRVLCLFRLYTLTAVRTSRRNQLPGRKFSAKFYHNHKDQVRPQRRCVSKPLIRFFGITSLIGSYYSLDNFPRRNNTPNLGATMRQLPLREARSRSWIQDKRELNYLMVVAYLLYCVLLVGCDVGFEVEVADSSDTRSITDASI